MAKLVYPELSYQLIGAAFKVYNTLGYGLPEKYYQRAYAVELVSLKISFEREYCVDLIYGQNKIGKCFLDFVADKKIVIEFKVQPTMKNIPVRQIYSYLRATNLELAIIIFVTRDGICYRRILNPDKYLNDSDKIRTD